MQKITLNIDGMKCSMCESHVSDAIRKGMPGASKVKASASKGEACFLIEDEQKADDAIASIERQGYKVLHVHSEPYSKKKFLFF